MTAPLLLEDGRSDGGHDQTLVVHGTWGQQLVPVEQRLERLRKDREVHTHKQIWTKDPHEGPYRKVGRLTAGHRPSPQSQSQPLDTRRLRSNP